ncbi:MAG: hypothetical protein ACJ780_01245 [Solirubrobacteraceae bacterium]
MTVEPHLVSHTHNATLRGVAGNIMTMNVRVLSSGDAACAVGTVGTLTLFESSNGQSNSVQFAFPAACKGQDHLYRGPQATEQVP